MLLQDVKQFEYMLMQKYHQKPEDLMKKHKRMMVNNNMQTGISKISSLQSVAKGMQSSSRAMQN